MGNLDPNLPNIEASLWHLNKFRYPILTLLLGLILVGAGVFLAKSGFNPSSTKVEVLEATTEAQGASSFVIVEISGQVEKPGVYKLQNGARIEDALIAAGGLSKNADRGWVEKSLNRAARLSDGQKIYIPSLDSARDTHSEVLSARNSAVYQTTSSNSDGQGSGLININTATAKELDSLPGIGQVYAQNIIEHRLYSNTEELVSKGALKKSVYEKIKDKITAY